ncbi:lipopolysaccharide biosynthesis protein [Mesobacillus jeotgali]|uniref:lipopolysaccharide biosynthesis protein n=1 Tax=Mesobacillus jeotgali TaxID=129985 RepID=UPI001CFEF6AC|nr:oligosaccharide flippase family protein [Mesobacillus jeotgali]
MKQNLLKKFISFSYGSGIGLIIGFFTTIVTTRILSPEDFGKASMFTLALNVSMIFIVFGTDQSFVRFFYEEKGEKRGGLLYNCLKFPLLLSAITMVIILIFNKPLSILLFEEENLQVMIVLLFGILIQVINRYAVLVVRMQQKGHLFSILEILNRSIQLLLVFFLYFLMGPSYEIIIFSTVLTVFILTFISINIEKKFWQIGNFSINYLKHSKIEILKYSYPLVLTTLITWLFQSFATVALRYWSNFEQVGLYAAAFKIVALLSVVQVAFTTFWSPIAYERFEASPESKEIFEKMSKIVAFGMFTISIGVIMFKDIIIMILGSEYAEAGKILSFLVFIPLMYTLSETTVMGINFYKKPKWHIVIAFVSCLVNILGNWLLVPDYGATGAAISTALSYIIFFMLRTHISLKYYKVNYGINKIYIIVPLISLFAFYSTHSDFLKNMISGMILFLLITILYWKDILTISRSYK